MSNHASLLISILVRYPEVGTIRYCPDSRTLRFVFILRRGISVASFTRFRRRLTDSLAALSSLTGRSARDLHLSRSQHGDVTLLEVGRDVETLSQEEISLVTALIHEAFPGALLSEGMDHLHEEERLAQEEVIGHMLGDLPADGQDRDLIGFREGGRVLVFNVPQPGSGGVR